MAKYKAVIQTPCAVHMCTCSGSLTYVGLWTVSVCPCSRGALPGAGTAREASGKNILGFYLQQPLARLPRTQIYFVCFYNNLLSDANSFLLRRVFLLYTLWMFYLRTFQKSGDQKNVEYKGKIISDLSIVSYLNFLKKHLIIFSQV